MTGLFLPRPAAPDDWAAGPAGLYVRAADPPADAGPPADPGPSPAAVPEQPVTGGEAAMLGAARAQARATWTGAVVALAAVAVSLFAWVGQRDLNRQQQKLNDYLITREQRVYASRVAVWAVDGRQESSVLSPGLDVVMQNRAPVPIRDVRIGAPVTGGDGQPPVRGAIAIGELEPCRLIRFRLSPPEGTSFVSADERWLGYSDLSVEFSEADRHWRLDGSRLTLLTGDRPPDPAPARLRIPRSRTSEPIGDCGEAG